MPRILDWQEGHRPRRGQNHQGGALPGLATALLLVLAACSPQLVARLGFGPGPDRSILTGEPCLLPCWYGIVPGETSETDALRLLLQNAHVDRQSLEKQVDKQGNVELFWLSLMGTGFDAVHVQGGIARVIALVPEIPLTLGDVTTRYGPPQSLSASYGSYEDPNYQYSVQLYYPSLGLSVYLHTKLLMSNNQPLINSDMRVTNIYYFEPGPMDAMFAEARDFGVSGLWTNHDMDRLEAWHGFGAYDIARDPFRP
jgi:hypothetical protein